MNFKAGLTAAFAFAVGGVLSADQTSLEVVDEVEISADTNIVVEAGKTLKFEYVYGKNSVTVTKSGAGRLEISTSSHRNLSVVVAEGTFASARPASIPLTDEFRPTMRIDAGKTQTITCSASGGTNFITKIEDADGGSDFWLKSIRSWGADYRDPYVATETLNGMGLIDFGTLRNTTKPAEGESPNPFYGGHGGCLGVNGSLKIGEYFYVWKDRDDAIDAAPAGIDPDTGFVGPTLMGNDPGVFKRGFGGFGKGFPFFSVGMSDKVKVNIHLDGEHVDYTEIVPRGFHVLRNRLKEDLVNEFSMLGRTIPHCGGFLLAELVVYTNKLSDAVAARVEAQLTAKWLGCRFAAVTLKEGAFLDAGNARCEIGTLEITATAGIAGVGNMKIGSLVRSSAAAEVSGTVTVDGADVSEMPDVVFDGDGAICVSGTSRVEKVTAASGVFVKSGPGTLKVAEPVADDIRVEEGALDVSALYVRSAAYHVDAAHGDSFEWSEVGSKQHISAWKDLEDPSRRFKATTYRKYPWGEQTLWNLPFLTENAAGTLPMVDFGTFANAYHTEGWGATLEFFPEISGKAGAQDSFVAWKDYPEVRNYPLNEGKEFIGPCFFGMQYHWARGKGGDGNGFAVHYGDAPSGMYTPAEIKPVIVDGAVVNALGDRLGDGVHVLAQRVLMTDNKPGAPIEQIGGDFQRHVYGGLMVGEVLVFTNMLSDSQRMRISGALCSKWRGDVNEWEYESVKVSAGAELRHPYADVVVQSLELSGKISAPGVEPGTIKVSGNGAEIDGELRLSDGGHLFVTGDPSSGLASVKATKVSASGSGTVSLDVALPASSVGSEFKIVDCPDVEASADFRWRMALPAGSGVKARLEARPDGVYLAVESGGMMILLK